MTQAQPAGENVRMIRPTLSDLPAFPLPNGFVFHALSPNEGHLWVSTWNAGDDCQHVDLSHWEREFACAPDEVPHRCFLIVAANGTPAATGSAWMVALNGASVGRIHWIATATDFQRKGLAKALMAHLLATLAKWHRSAILDTQSNRLPAIRLYKTCGFVPDLSEPGSAATWRAIENRLDSSGDV